MTSRNATIRALKELECMNEAMYEMERDETTEERSKVIWAELATRVWAAIYALQYMDKAPENRPEKYEEIMQAADMFDGVDDEDAERH